MQPSIVNNKYLAGQKKGLFFLLLNPCPPPSLLLTYLPPPPLSFSLFTWLVSPAGKGSDTSMIMASLACAAGWTEKPATTHTHTQHALLPPTLWSLLMCCVKMYFSFVFMASTSVEFLFYWYLCIFFHSPSTCLVLENARRRHYCCP